MLSLFLLEEMQKIFTSLSFAAVVTGTKCLIVLYAKSLEQLACQWGRGRQGGGAKRGEGGAVRQALPTRTYNIRFLSNEDTMNND